MAALCDNHRGAARTLLGGVLSCILAGRTTFVTMERAWRRIDDDAGLASIDGDGAADILETLLAIVCLDHDFAAACTACLDELAMLDAISLGR